MGISNRQRACALLLALTLVIGTALGGIPATGAAHCHCRPDCPMHRGGLGCHHAAKIGCHHQRGPGLHCACGDHSQASTSLLPIIRAVLACRSDSRPLLTRSSLIAPIRTFLTQFVIEPPTDPPRASVV